MNTCPYCDGPETSGGFQHESGCESQDQNGDTLGLWDEIELPDDSDPDLEDPDRDEDGDEEEGTWPPRS